MLRREKKKNENEISAAADGALLWTMWVTCMNGLLCWWPVAKSYHSLLCASKMAARDFQLARFHFFFFSMSATAMTSCTSSLHCCQFSTVADQWSGALRYLLNEQKKNEGEGIKRDKDQISYEFLGKREEKKKLRKKGKKKYLCELSISRSDVNG